MSVQVVVLAAGRGKRMHSNIPKVLHELAGKPLLAHVLSTAANISALPPVVVCGYQADVVKSQFSHWKVHWVEQKEQLGTGHAVLKALPTINADHHVLILYGDVPLISAQTLNQLMTETPKKAVGLLVFKPIEPMGYGRIKRDRQQNITAIVEEKDTTDEEYAIKEVNSGIYYLPAAYLHQWLVSLNQVNKQGEYYLTDIIKKAVSEHIDIYAMEPDFEEEVLGVNDRAQLARLERFYQRRYAEQLLKQGVTLYDPERLDVRGELQVGQDVVIDINVIMEGRVVIGNGCRIGPNTILRNTILSDGVEVKAHSVLEGAIVAANGIIGPFARLRPGTYVDQHAHIGNFVEIKNSQIGAGTKISHLSYIGDSEVGKNVNIGAGTITCNYDGVNKHKTIIGDETHIGSDTQLIAPVTIGAHATIGAGSTIVKDVPGNSLTLTHKIEQRTIKEWQRPEKE